MIRPSAAFSHMADVEAALLDPRPLDGGLEAQQRWQGAALDRVGDLLHDCQHCLDVLGRHVEAPGGLSDPLPDFAWEPERAFDPAVPSHAIRIVLELALDGVPELGECGDDPGRLAGRARILSAMAQVRRFVALWGDDLDGWLRKTVTALSGSARGPAQASQGERARALIPHDPAHRNVVLFAPRRA